MDVNLQENKTFKSLMSGNVLNARTTLPFMTEVVRETFAPNGIAISHWRRRKGMWPALSKKTKSKKGHGIPWVMSGRALAAISKPMGGKVLHWGSSADIHSGTMRWRDRYSSHGVYASTRGNRKEALLVLGFNGRYKHSAGFNRVRREYASEIAGKKITKISDARRIISVGGTMARMRAVNQDRIARGLKPIRKTAAMGAQGIRNGKFVLARGKDNLAYADIVQRGVFKGIRANTGVLINPRGISAGRRRGILHEGTLEFGVKRPLLPYAERDHPRIARALDRSMRNLAREINR